MRRYRIWRFIQSSHVISDEALAELDIILARLNKSPYPILPNRININYQTLSIQSADYVIFDNMPVVSDNRPVESDNMPVESDNMPVESDNMPVDSDNMPVHCSS